MHKCLFKNILVTLKLTAMPKYLVKASYTVEGVKGLLKEGGTSRKKAVEKMINELGGKVEAFYFAFGDTDVYSIIDLPDAESASAVSLTINAGGYTNTSLTVLITPDEADTAVRKTVSYTPPGK
jgi:uncharacterized protein with GYD domain